MKPLVLSLFPGIGLLDLAFEEEGFAVVRGPDLLWGGDVRRFHVPHGRFDGVVGGPPCQAHSDMTALNEHAGRHGDQIPEFERLVREAQPAWFIMENVEGAPLPAVTGYGVHSILLNARWLGSPQNRLRRFSFGTRDGRRLLIAGEAFEPLHWEPAVLAGHGMALSQRKRGIPERTWRDNARLQGLSEEWIATMDENAPFTVQGFKHVIGNGVPLPMGRAVARAVRSALYTQEAA